MTDQNREPFENGDSLEKVMQILKEIVEKSADGDYLYRGEPEHYCRVSSSLYRRREEIKIEGLDIEIAQVEMLKSAQEFAGQMDEDDLLAQLQHFGSVTNLIDFTTDCLIALFFACDQKPGKDGRVILLNRTRHTLFRPTTPENRAIAQKSVFVRSPEGFVEPDKIVRVPHDLKEPILDYLSNLHGLRAATIYNDIHGFVRYHKGHESAYLEFYAGRAHQLREEHQEAIERFSTAIKLIPQLPSSHNNRGNAYAAQGNLDLAIRDYDRAIELNPRYVGAYNNRGKAYMDMRKLNRAIRDLDRAIELDPYFAPAYINRGIVYGEKGAYDRAIQDLNKAIALDPSDAAAYTIRGVAYGKKCEYDLAIQDFDETIALNPRDAVAYSNRGYAYMQKGDINRAIRNHDKAIVLNPKEAIANYNRGMCWLLIEQWDKAQRDIAIARRLGLDTVSTFYDEFGRAADFEKRYNVKLPSDIAAMLTPSSEVR